MGCVLALIRTDLTAYNRYRVRINVILLCHVCFFVGPRCWFVRCVNLYINIRRAHANTTKASLFTPSLIFAQLSLEIKLKAFSKSCIFAFSCISRDRVKRISDSFRKPGGCEPPSISGVCARPRPRSGGWCAPSRSAKRMLIPCLKIDQ